MVDWAHPSCYDSQEKTVKAVGYEELSSLDAATDVPSHTLCFEHTAKACLSLHYGRSLSQLPLDKEQGTKVDVITPNTSLLDISTQNFNVI